MGEWKDGVIQTGVDKLMEYLKKEKEVRVDEAADSLEVDPETVITWAKSLEQSGLAELRYTARRGRVISISGKEKKTEEVMEEVKEDASESVEKLADLGREKGRMDRFKDILDRLEQHISDDEEFVEELREEQSGAGRDIKELETFIDDLESVEEDVSGLKEHLDALKKDIEVLSQLDALKQSASEPEPTESEQADGGGMSPLYPLKKLVSLVPRPRSKTAALACSVCEKEFDTEQGLDMHKRLTGHGEESGGGQEPVRGKQESPERHGGDESDETFKCPTCDKQFDSLRGIQTHMGMTHDEKYRGGDTS